MNVGAGVLEFDADFGVLGCLHWRKLDRHEAGVVAISGHGRSHVCQLALAAFGRLHYPAAQHVGVEAIGQCNGCR